MIKHIVSPMRTRLDLLETLPKNSIGAELGVFEGTFSDEILRIVQPSLFFLVDLFTGMVVSGDQDGRNIHGADMRAMLARLRSKYAMQNVMVIQDSSYFFLNKRPAHSLDWVYIDTDHTYSTARAELTAAVRAVKPGGIIAGHDYHPQHYPGLVQAVNEFCAATQLTVEIFDGDALPSFKIQLP